MTVALGGGLALAAQGAAVPTLGGGGGGGGGRRAPLVYDDDELVHVSELDDFDARVRRARGWVSAPVGYAVGISGALALALGLALSRKHSGAMQTLFQASLFMFFHAQTAALLGLLTLPALPEVEALRGLDWANARFFELPVQRHTQAWDAAMSSIFEGGKCAGQGLLRWEQFNLERAWALVQKEMAQAGGTLVGLTLVNFVMLLTWKGLGWNVPRLMNMPALQIMSVLLLLQGISNTAAVAMGATVRQGLVGAFIWFSVPFSFLAAVWTYVQWKIINRSAVVYKGFVDILPMNTAGAMKKALMMLDDHEQMQVMRSLATGRKGMWLNPAAAERKGGSEILDPDRIETFEIMERTGFMNKFAVIVEDTRCSKSRLRSGFLKKEALVVAASHFQMLLSSLTLGVFAVPCASVCYSGASALCSWFQPLLLLMYTLPVTVGIAFIRPYDAPLRQNLELSAGLLDCMTLALALLRALFPFKGAGGAIAALQIAKIWLQVVGVWHALYLSVRLHGVGVCLKRKPFMEAIILRSVRQNSARQLNVRSAKARLRTTVGGKHQDFSISWNGQHDKKDAAAPLPASRPSRSSLFEEDVGIIFEDGFQASGESSPEASPAGLFRDDREEAPGDVELETSRTPKARAQKVAARKSVVVVTSTKKNPLMGGGEDGNDGAKGTDGGAPGQQARDGGGRKSVSNPLLVPGDAGSRRGKRASVSDPLLEGPGPGSGGVSDGGPSEAVRKDEVTPKRAPRASVVMLGPKATENPLSALKRGQALHPEKRRGAGRASVIQPNALGGVVTLTDSEGHEVVCSAPAHPPAKEEDEPAIGGFFLTAADAVLGLDGAAAAVEARGAAPAAKLRAEESAPKRLMNTFSQMSSVMDRLAKLKARRAEKKKDASPQGASPQVAVSP